MLNLEGITAAFAKAKQNGIKRPKVRLLAGAHTYEFSRAPDNGKNAGAIYVTSYGDYLGKIVEGKFIPVSVCSREQVSEVLIGSSDPLAAAVAYGRRYDICSCCGRPLSNAESIELGIGPICRSKFF
jgi:hypothetical protein